jgi:hypothetical protein
MSREDAAVAGVDDDPSARGQGARLVSSAGWGCEYERDQGRDERR